MGEEHGSAALAAGVRHTEKMRVRDVAATPVGMTVTAEVELIEVNGRSLLFTVSARDDTDLIGEGAHRRAVIDTDRFMARLAAKSGRTTS